MESRVYSKIMVSNHWHHWLTSADYSAIKHLIRISPGRHCPSDPSYISRAVLLLWKMETARYPAPCLPRKKGIWCNPEFRKGRLQEILDISFLGKFWLHDGTKTTKKNKNNLLEVTPLLLLGHDCVRIRCLELQQSS